MVDDVSSRFPFISLEKALLRAQAIFEGDKSGKAMAVTTAFTLWNYSPKSSGGFQTIAALKAYGLLEDEGNNADRRVKLTASAKRYFLDERDDVRQNMLVEFAMNPALFHALWHKDKWNEGIPADPVARSHLKIERGLNEQSARAALGILKENISYAGVRSETPEASSLDPSVTSSEVQKVSEKPEPQTSNQLEEKALKLERISQSGKQIIFDMETITVAASFNNGDDLQAFIDKLEKLKPLLPQKAEIGDS